MEDNLCQPILIGRPDIIEQRLKRYGLSIRPGKDFEVINPERDDRYRDYVNTLLEVAGRNGITPDAAKTIVRTSTTAIGALAIIRNDADALICGLEGRFIRHKQYIDEIIGRQPGIKSLHAMSLLIDQRRAMFMTDTYIAEDPDAEQIAEVTRLAAKEIERFGITPKAALLSASDFGSRPMPTSRIMRQAAGILAETNPELEVDGEMHADTALDEAVREKVYPLSRLKGRANLLDDTAAAEDMERVRQLFDVLERQQGLLEVLDSTRDADGVRLFIGSENSLFPLSGSSVIVAPYMNAERQVIGALGVIGPTRLNYARVIPMVDYTARMVGEVLGKRRQE